MEINTHRLCLIPLTAEHLDLLADDLSQAEAALNCVYQGPVIDCALQDILRERAEQTPDQWLWYTFWLILRKQDRAVVGHIEFDGPPNQKGEVQLRYALSTQHSHQGYMTEAVYELCNWAKQQPGVRYFMAETEDDDFAAQRVLQRCNFIEWGGEKNIRWCRSASVDHTPGWNILKWELVEND